MHAFPNDVQQVGNSKNPHEVLTDWHVLSIWLIFKESQVHISKAWGFTTLYLLLLTFPSVKVIPLDTCSNEKSTLGKKPLQSSHAHGWKALLTPALVSKELKMALLKEKHLYRVRSQARESIPVNSAVRTRLFIHLFCQNQVHSFLPCEAEGCCFKIIPLRDVSRQISSLQSLEDKHFPLVQLFLWAQERTHFTPLNFSGRMEPSNIHSCVVKGIVMEDQHLMDFFLIHKVSFRIRI